MKNHGKTIFFTSLIWCIVFFTFAFTAGKTAEQIDEGAIKIQKIETLVARADLNPPQTRLDSIYLYEALTKGVSFELVRNNQERYLYIVESSSFLYLDTKTFMYLKYKTEDGRLYPQY